MSKVYKVIFSPTGTSQNAAEIMANPFDKKTELIDLCQNIQKEIEIEKESICIFSIPCYGGRIPQIAAKRISHLRGNDAYAILCITYGNRAFEDALLELSDCVEAAGFNVIGGCAVIGEHNIMHIYGTGRPDNSDKKEIKHFATEAAHKIQIGNTHKPEFPGNRPYKEAHNANTEILVDKNLCENCGLCSIKCPTQAISIDRLHVDQSLCINCMRCIQICPNNCRSISKEFVSSLIQKAGKACEGRKENKFYL